MNKLYLLLTGLTLTIGVLASAAYLGTAEVWVILQQQWSTILLTLGLVCLATLANLGLRWVRWHYLNRKFSVYLPTRHSLRVYFALLPSILTPLYCGEVLRAAFMERYSERPWAHTGRVWMIERSADLGIVLFFVSLADPDQRYWALPTTLLCLLLSQGFVARCSKSLPQRLEIVALVVGSGVLAWSITALMLSLVVHMLGPSLPLRDSIAAFSESTILGSVSLLPGGVGVTGTSMLESLRSHDIGLAAATVTVLVFRAGTTWFAVALGAVVFLSRRRQLREPEATERSHFDQIAGEYSEQISDHMRDRLLASKTGLIVETLTRHGITSGCGLDFGCGQGWYAGNMAERGFSMIGCDASSGQLAWAQRNVPQLQVAQLEQGRISLPDNSVDFAYSINVMHHIEDPALRETSWRELVRVVRPGGLIMIHEMNTLNPVFRFYLGYVFPLIKSIDEGTEQWLDPHALPEIDGAQWQTDTCYFTFVPDFVPTWLGALLAPLERWLENSRFKHWSAHFFSYLVTDRRT